MSTKTSFIFFFPGLWKKGFAIFAAILLSVSVVGATGMSAQEEINWNDTRVTVLHRAAKSGNFAEAQVELANGVDVNARNKWQGTPLHYAARYGKKALVKLLIAHGALVNVQDSDGRTPLYMAANSLLKEPEQQLALVTLLVRVHHADVTLAGHFERTVLHQAAEWNSDMVVFLVENGASVQAQDRDGKMPLHLAAEKGHLSIVEFLIQAGAAVNVQDTFWKMTPLHRAVLGGHEDVVRFLVEKGADLNVVSKYHGTVLHCAVLHKNQTMVEYLVAVGVQIDLRNAEGETPLDRALLASHQDIVQILADALDTLDLGTVAQINEKFAEFDWSKITIMPPAPKYAVPFIRYEIPPKH